MKKIIILLITSFILFSCTQNEQKTVQNNNAIKDKIKIVTSIIPLASISNYIGGDFVDAEPLIPVGVSAHGYDLKPKQMIDIEKSDLIVYLGLEHIDGFLNKTIENKNKIAVSENIELLKASEEHEEEHHEEEEEAGHDKDPHIWTSSSNAIIIATKIKDKLVKLQPENKLYFETNLENFKKEIENIKNNFVQKTKDKRQNNFIVFHDAYNYLFQELNIDEKNKLVFQKTVLNDPNSSEMKKLIDDIKSYSIKIAYKEPQLDDKNFTKLSNDYNIHISSLNPLGTNSLKEGFIENYKLNLEALEKIYE